MIRKCKACKEKKDLSEFCKNKNLKGGFGYRCKECQREMSSKHYIKNKAKYKLRSETQRVGLRTWIKELKSKLSCIKCGESHWSCLEFHHKDEKKKDFAISIAVRFNMTREQILEEIAKCDVLCSNCHRKHHHP